MRAAMRAESYNVMNAVTCWLLTKVSVCDRVTLISHYLCIRRDGIAENGLNGIQERFIFLTCTFLKNFLDNIYLLVSKIRIFYEVASPIS